MSARCVAAASRRCERAAAERSSLAFTSRTAYPAARAATWASVVFPTPGGPDSSVTCSSVSRGYSTSGQQNLEVRPLVRIEFRDETLELLVARTLKGHEWRSLRSGVREAAAASAHRLLPATAVPTELEVLRPVNRHQTE